MFVFSDIETEGLGVHSPLLQIAAVSEDGKEFNVYINPRKELALGCTNFCGFYYYRNQLYRDGQPLPTVRLRQGLLQFCRWLESLGDEVSLVFHNGFSFDCFFIAKCLKNQNLQLPSNTKIVHDSLPCLRKTLKDPAPPNFKLTTLAEHFEIPTLKAHDALSDSRVLRGICEKAAIQQDKTLQELLGLSTRPFQQYLDKYDEKNKTRKPLPNPGDSKTDTIKP